MTAERFPVEAGHIMMFARAIGDRNPAYYAGADLVSDLDHVIAPPTFVEASIHYDQVFPYRPRIGEPWYGSAAESASGSAPEPAAGPAGSAGSSFHAETHLEYFGLLHPGEVLDVRERPAAAWRKQGARGGQLWFNSYIVEFFKDDEIVVRNTTVVVSTAAKIDPADAGPARDALPVSVETRDPAVTTISDGRISGAAGLALGEVRKLQLVKNLSRAQILMYAGAVGDFSPQHTDELWNTQVAGYPSTFAHGMLTMGMTGRVLTDWFGNAPLRVFSMRFLRQVWPGDTLFARAEVTALERDGGYANAELSLETTNANRQVVASGSARVELPA